MGYAGPWLRDTAESASTILPSPMNAHAYINIYQVREYPRRTT
jgi:hypothetical protein